MNEENKFTIQVSVSKQEGGIYRCNLIGISTDGPTNIQAYELEAVAESTNALSEILEAHRRNFNGKS